VVTLMNSRPFTIRQVVLCAWIAALTIAACQPQSPRSIDPSITHPAALSTPVPVTGHAVANASATSSAVFVPRTSPTLEETVAPIPTPTWTPLPAVPPATADAIVEDLLKNNAGCRLPCWWGVVPGETQWSIGPKHVPLCFAESGQPSQLNEARQGCTSICARVSRQIASRPNRLVRVARYA
jgi:hypothetical protein